MFDLEDSDLDILIWIKEVLEKEKEDENRNQEMG